LKREQLKLEIGAAATRSLPNCSFVNAACFEHYDSVMPKVLLENSATEGESPLQWHAAVLLSV